MNHKKALFWFLLLTVTQCFVIGCGPAYKDVTSTPRYNFSSFAGTTWETKTNVAMADIKSYTGRHELSLLVPKYYDTNNPDYTTVDDCKVITILPIGTHLRIERLMQDNGGEWGGVKVLATIQDGSNSQKTVFLDRELLAKNSFIRGGDSTSTNWDANPEMLEKTAAP